MITGIKLKNPPAYSILSKGMIDLEDLTEYEASYTHGLKNTKCYIENEAALYKENTESNDILLAVFSNRIAMAKLPYERSKTTFGQLINILTRVEWPGYVHINGVEFITILKLSKESIGMKLRPKYAYYIPF